MKAGGPSGSTRGAHPGASVCAVCGATLDARNTSAISDNATCAAMECKRLWQQRRSLPAPVFEQKRRHAADVRTIRARRQRELRAAREQALARRASAQAHWEAAVTAACDDYAQRRDLIPSVQLESPTATLTNLPKRRITAYQQHLYTVIGEAFSTGRATGVSRALAADPAPEDVDRGHASLVGRLCAVCQGRCCSAGGDRAYVSAETIRKLRRARPGIRPQAVFKLYMAALATRTVAYSCSNHTASGCGLGRELRSTTCNAFFCDALKEFDTRRSRLPAPVAGALLISHKHPRERGMSGPFATTVYLVEPGETRALSLAHRGDGEEA